jgi:hypothetical protein
VSTLDATAVPALCEKCGQWFTNPLFVVEGEGAVVSSEGAKINHLGCGGMGVIPEGEYTFTEDGVRAVLAAGLSADDISTLVAVLEKTRGAVTYEELLAVVEEAPPAVATAIKQQLPADAGAARANLKMLAAALATVAIAAGGVEVAHEDAEMAHRMRRLRRPLSNGSTGTWRRRCRRSRATLSKPSCVPSHPAPLRGATIRAGAARATSSRSATDDDAVAR